MPTDDAHSQVYSSISAHAACSSPLDSQSHRSIRAFVCPDKVVIGGDESLVFLLDRRYENGLLIVIVLALILVRRRVNNF